MKTTSRTISQIVRAHTLTYFNLLNVILAGFIILSGQYKNMLFMGIVISNSLIGIIQECKVKSLIDKLSVITATKARKLTADGTITEIPIESLAVSDTIHIMTGDQIVADGEVLTSDGLEVNESHLTGESIPVFKKPGDFLYSGSFIVAGSGTAKVLKSVEDSYAAKLTKRHRRNVEQRLKCRMPLNELYAMLVLPLYQLVLPFSVFSISVRTTPYQMLW